MATTQSNQVKHASDGQVKFILALFDERELSASPKFALATLEMDADQVAAYVERCKSRVTTQMSMARARELIEHLKDLPLNEAGRQRLQQRQGAQTKPAPDVPDGHYALETADDELNPIRFYRVRTGQHGKWTGFKFVDRYASDERYPVRGVERHRVLEAIDADVLAAAQRYGREARRCSFCNRKLTRRISRECGCGPVCGQRNGVLDAEYVHAAEQRIRARGEDPNSEVADVAQVSFDQAILEAFDVA